MDVWVWAILIVILAVAGTYLGWGWASRQLVLPCPTWLAWLLEGQIADKVLNTQRTLDRIGISSGQSVLEVGPGTGRLLIPAARRVAPGGRAVGLDLQPGMSDRLRVRADRAGICNLTAVTGDATGHHFPAESFDVVYLCAVLGEIPDQTAVLQRCHEVLKPGGQLSITEIFFGDPHFQRRQKVERLATAAGFVSGDFHGHWYYYTANFAKPVVDRTVTGT
jgi:ubiquinone/menaquinone biosynthesis C-methylase UbiE